MARHRRGRRVDATVAARSDVRWRWLLARSVAIAVGGATLTGLAIARAPDAGDRSAVDLIAPAPTTTAAPPTTTTAPPVTTTTEPPYDGWVDPELVGVPFSTEVEGLLTFRGSPTRSYYGEGPVPRAPVIQWRFPPDRTMCSLSSVGSETREWCGTGWTGQPAIWEREGRTWVAFGAYDRNVHFLDADSGEPTIAPFATGDIIKGSVSVDPDGYPLLYSGSRDNRVHVIAYDRDPPVELWSLAADAVSPRLWNDDWDGSPLIVDDYLFEGGENSQIHVVKLNRGYDLEGHVTVDPELVWNAPGWDDELLSAIGDRNVSIENSVAISGNTLYFSNSGGLVQGWDISGLRDGIEPTRSFRYWVGDDTDASIVIDEDGMLYVGAEYERGTARSQELGQVIKLDPTRPDDPVVWSVDASGGIDTGVWATPGLHRDILVVPTMDQGMLGIDRATGEVRWTVELGWHLWQSPAIVDDVLLMGDCEGVMHAFDIADTTVAPTEIWRIELGGCIESTPAVWRGRIIVGARGGQVYALGDP